MRGLLAALLMALLQVPAAAEAPTVTEAAARPTVLPRTPLDPGITDSRLQCFVEVGAGVTVSYRPVSVAPIKRHIKDSILITCDSANTSSTDEEKMLLVCSRCKADMGDAVATSPTATVDAENNRLLLAGTKHAPVLPTIGRGDKSRTVSAKELAISIND